MNISAYELKQLCDNSEPILIIDVREELEFHTFNIGGVNIPLGILIRTIEELNYDKRQQIIVVCQRGLRSETARRVLTDNGFLNVKNLHGGLLAWRKVNQNLV
ncbi:rhodanese-like domain-containing protein [Daejeonella oryzae]|uniref:rhodanese-like domain-containing protein n=1 Tax=Daejeonella oryzae TaxID=1122943 RepID=UPI0003F56669|nr:rhodanese-like domain-containing protein [Daejeonella oryzae]